MNLLSLQEVSKQYEHRILLKNISLNIAQGERIAVIGKNGSGKSSLLNIIAGKLSFDSGERMGLKHLHILSLAQKPIFKPQASVISVLIESMGKLKSAYERLELLQTQMAQTSAPSKDMLEEYAKLSAYLDEHRGWDLQSRAEEILAYFELEGFKDRLANSLSGGEQKRVALASLLLEPCDILLLDEPTNHLDVEMVAFLENYLLQSHKTLVFISHDRYFIDKVATRIVEIDEGQLRSFEGGYLQYLSKKEEILKHLSKAHEKLLKLLKNEEQWLRQGVKARLKRNEGRKNKILQMREEAKKNPSTIRKMRLELEREQKAFNREEGINNQKCLFEIEHLHKSIAGKVLFKDLNLRILRGDRIAIVGKNGSGKSSLLKILLGEQSADSGVVKKGDIRIGYFEQHTNMLDDKKDLLETFCPNGGEHIEVRGKHMHIYGYLKNFLFPKEFLTHKIGSLSGGEKNRVALALLFTKEVDVFILDEPTNDLDIQTINIIEEYLLSLSNAVIFVSHDRYFVDKLAHKLLVFEGDGEVVQSHILYSQYLEIAQNLREISEFEQTLSQNIESKKLDSIKHKPDAPKKPQKLSYKQKLALQSLPLEIEELEQKQKALKEALSNPQIYEQQGISTLAKELADVENELESKIAQYLDLEEQNMQLSQAT
ncbi:ABC transporter ATP-binding protein [Helicobacter jaachi]|uniref:ABC transporter ATP-binding protein n=1 Tax=Helicobacter jaachi TaxID=1677920 RepID=A0A4U8T8S8_9HELI|nr:ABC-F family ATP-binding cassette domain-containing protein [Helicobacter jaachi]TLD96055.1 ABC transporter ATP-binding protein [Helicobacter jaachi]